MKTPAALICNRLVDMAVMHPAQVTYFCHDCEQPVGVYPSGQRSIKLHPKMLVRCTVCAGISPIQIFKGLNVKMLPAASWDEVAQEMLDSKPVSET